MSGTPKPTPAQLAILRLLRDGIILKAERGYRPHAWLPDAPRYTTVRPATFRALLKNKWIALVHAGYPMDDYGLTEAGRALVPPGPEATP